MYADNSIKHDFGSQGYYNCTDFYRLTEPTEAEDGEVFDPKKKVGMTSPDFSKLLASAQRVSVPDWLAPELEKVKVCALSQLRIHSTAEDNFSHEV